MSLCEKPAIGDPQPCSLPPRIWENCRKIPDGHPPVLSVRLEMPGLEPYLVQLRQRKQSGDDE
eukprot:210897-Rhodomonas_salina.1